MAFFTAKELSAAGLVQDYYAINPEFGTLDDFKRLVNSAHKLGFHIIIDLVANHTAWDSKLIKEHPDWFTKNSAGTIVSPNPDWTDVAALNYAQPGLRRYMIEMMKYWVRDIGVDGFRCDVAELVPTFWEDARAALDSIKPVMMLAEGCICAAHLKAFDLSYGWNTYQVLAPIIEGKKSALALDTVLDIERSAYPHGSLRMRFSSNHDENAWDASDVKKFGIKGAKLAAVVVNTLPGIPLLYNGQEVGNTKKLKLFEKISIDWKDEGGFRKLYAKLFNLRKNEPAFSDGEMLRLSTSNSRHVYAFARISSASKFIVVLNFNRKAFNGSRRFVSWTCYWWPNHSYRCFQGKNFGRRVFVKINSFQNPCDGVSHSSVTVKSSLQGCAYGNDSTARPACLSRRFPGRNDCRNDIVNNPGTWGAIYPQLEHSA